MNETTDTLTPPDRPSSAPSGSRLVVTPIRVTALEITGAPSLDPIRVILQEYGPGQGRIIIECFGEAWGNYWGAMGQQLAEFVAGCEGDYVVNRLASGRRNKKDTAYLTRIVAAVQKGLRQFLSENT